MAKVWLVVAESSRAKIYASDMHLSDITEVDDLVHPASRLHERDITSDLPGRNASSGAGSHHSIDDQTSAKTAESEEFARQVDGYLLAGLNEKKYDKLAIVSAPAFLGQLRQHLNKNVAANIIFELDKSLLHCKANELKSHLPKHL